MSRATPTNASLERLFRGARSARVFTGPPESRPLSTFEAGDLGRLHTALRVREGGEPFHCMCLGTLRVEVFGRLLRTGTLTYHHGQSVRAPGWDSDAWLEDGPALLKLLAERGIGEPLEQFDREQDVKREGLILRQEWERAVPAALSPLLASLERDLTGLPGRPAGAVLAEAVELLRQKLDSGTDVARALIRWLAAGHGPWSGYPGYEDVPLQLLRTLPPQDVVSVALGADLSPAELHAATRHLCSHDVVSFHKSWLADLPESFFERARAGVAPGDDRDRFEHAVRVAQGAREGRLPRAPFEAGDGCWVLGVSRDGDLQDLAAHRQSLYSFDIRTLVRFDPGSVVPVVVAEAPDQHVLLAAGERPVFATSRPGEVTVLEEGGPRLLAGGQQAPIELVAVGDRIAWLNRNEPKGRILVTANLERELGSIGPLSGAAWSLELSGDALYWIQDAWSGPGEVRRAVFPDGRPERVVRIPRVGPSSGSPRLTVSEGEVLLPQPGGVMALDAQGRARLLVESPTRVHGIAVSKERLVLLVEEKGEERWAFAVAPRAGGRAVVIGSFSRRPYHRHPLVVAGGWVCTTVGDRILGAPLPT